MLRLESKRRGTTRYTGRSTKACIDEQRRRRVIRPCGKLPLTRPKRRDTLPGAGAYSSPGLFFFGSGKILYFVFKDDTLTAEQLGLQYMARTNICSADGRRESKKGAGGNSSGPFLRPLAFLVSERESSR